MGDVVTEYISNLAVKGNKTDKACGMHIEEQYPGYFYTVSFPLKIDGNNIIIRTKMYEGTKGLREFFVSTTPD